MRFFFNSFRYSEDIDLDIGGIEVLRLQDLVMNILRDNDFKSSFKPFGIEEVIPPDIAKAKQTETTQRFKVHLIASGGEGLFTKIKCTRRGFDENKRVETVSEKILRAYKSAPVLVPHYDSVITCRQKINALAKRSIIQARDIFDLYILIAQIDEKSLKKYVVSTENRYLEKAYENVFAISFRQFRDSVLFYLSDEDQQMYDNEKIWDEVKLKVANLIERLSNG